MIVLFVARNKMIAVTLSNAAVLVSLALAPIQAEISIRNIEQTLRAIDIDRTSGSDGERASAEYLARKLGEYNVRHTVYDARVFLSWPGRADVIVDGIGTIRGKTAAFSGATPNGGLRGTLIFNATPRRRVDGSLQFGGDVRGKIPVVRGIADTEALVLAAQEAGAIAVMQIDATDTLHEDIVTTTWGTPTPESAARLPRIPYVCVAASDGDRLTRSAANSPVTLQVEVTRGWRTIPIVVADVPGRTPDFVIVATHLDAWYHGMTDTGGTDASILEMARVLQRHAGELTRGVRFAWWTGHSFGRYAGSGWYVDHFWADLDTHAVAYTNLDGSGRRRSRLDGVVATGWPGLAEYARDSAVRITGKTPTPPRNLARVFRPGRDSDSAFQGLGIPFVSIGVPGPDRGSGDVDEAGRVVYWHTAEDTYDKLDLKALELDTQYRVAQIYDLATVLVLPHRLEPIADAYVAAVTDLAGAATGTFNLETTVKLAAAFRGAAARFDAAPKPTRDPEATQFNEFVVRLTHQLNSTLYTKAGRFDQDPAAELPILPLLARVKDLAALPRDSDPFGFVETELLRGRNQVDATLRDASAAIDRYFAAR